MSSLYPWYRRPLSILGNVLGYLAIATVGALLFVGVIALVLLFALLLCAFLGFVPAVVFYACWNWVLAGALSQPHITLKVFWAACTALTLAIRLITNGVSFKVNGKEVVDYDKLLTTLRKSRY